MFFEITHTSTECRARTGIMHTDHGDIETPIFMPVGTKATVKSLDTTDLEHIGAQIILANTYHLHLRPGEDLVADMGGLHTFMNWNKPILTDSGGFQVFSLGLQKELKNKNGEKLVSIDDNGVDFRSHIDGSKHRFTPESAIEIQHKLGADIIMAFDECTPDSASLHYAEQALDRTHRWAKESLEAHQTFSQKKFHPHKQFLFGIIQGANHKELREASAKAVSALNFDGIAIGGESIGYNMEATKNILDWVNPLIPEDKPHYTMGVGLMPSDLFDVVERGVDMFDCVSPTRVARNGTLFISPKERKKLGTIKQTLNIENSEFRADPSPIDCACTCFTCTHHSRAYIHHLFKENELLAYRLGTLHNLHFLTTLMTDMRKAIRENTFLELKHIWM
ncbi:MAG: tRNA guanosine(34) transglycosylase Tgt [Candidatus Magasanikbacteria bacterium CG10_big_fil_rev_8_21_14_0_10_43_6]|uniref:Queuine tRNA-ribosyltransferase n=1 Tax=Candidatus Magasanikbacteria bacterium CG10_big_fil_rev_8_21_14_0_10_43_6 TaxID=1974650 RepID=A0A2M6VZT0_9BACT|nr:MAG: tRNA guanosine(34) transglycosylase Tgt [Candidatus Magasanikbacteria bacterium CG10_big_fil_rev_8_21_14_0_10_43_6]